MVEKKEYRCEKCNKLLATSKIAYENPENFKTANHTEKDFDIEIKCSRCKFINEFKGTYYKIDLSDIKPETFEIIEKQVNLEVKNIEGQPLENVEIISKTKDKIWFEKLTDSKGKCEGKFYSHEDSDELFLKFKKEKFVPYELKILNAGQKLDYIFVLRKETPEVQNKDSGNGNK